MEVDCVSKENHKKGRSFTYFFLWFLQSSFFCLQDHTDPKKKNILPVRGSVLCAVVKIKSTFYECKVCSFCVRDFELLIKIINRKSVN